MGLRGALRAAQAAERRMQRDAQRRYKELQRQTKEQAKVTALEKARLEVETLQARIEVLLSLHKEVGFTWNWTALYNKQQPALPQRADSSEKNAIAKRDSYSPGIFARLFGVDKRRIARFEKDVVSARQKDDEVHARASNKYQEELADWQSNHSLAEKVIAGDSKAYLHVLNEVNPFAEISELGSSTKFIIHSPTLIECVAKIEGEQAIPREEKSLTATGRVSAKAMPKGRFHELYQDYIGSCVLRIGREIFALLPVDIAIVTVTTDLFNSRTGHTDEEPILTVALTRHVMETLNYDLLDPYDSMENFVHRDDFNASRKTGIFQPIEPLSANDVKVNSAPVDKTGCVETSGGIESVSTDPFAEQWAESMRCNEIENGFLCLTVNQMVELLGCSTQETFSLSESRELANNVEAYGYCIEPDPRCGAGSFWGTRAVGLFRSPTSGCERHSDQYVIAAALLRLCIMVAASDGSISSKELDPFRRFVFDNCELSADQQQHLAVLETLLLRTPATEKTAFRRTIKLIPKEKHLAVARFLVDVATADGSVAVNELPVLTRIFEELGLSNELLFSLVQNMPREQQEVVVQEQEQSASGEIIPPAVAIPKQHSGLKIDMTRVAIISAETADVMQTLTKALSGDDTAGNGISVSNTAIASDRSAGLPAPIPDLTNEVAVVPETRQAGNALDIRDHTTPLSKPLDVRYRNILTRLTSKSTWSQAEFSAIAAEEKLMPLSVIDAINEWANETLGDFLLEGDEIICINRQLLPETLCQK